MNANRTSQAPAVASSSLGTRALLQGVKPVAGQVPALAAAAASGALQQRAKGAGSGQAPAPAAARLPPGWQK